jgi:hypothetical protein
MPLKSGGSKKDLSANIKELMKSYHEKGTIGNITPKSGKKAQKVSVAIAYRKMREGK